MGPVTVTDDQVEETWQLLRQLRNPERLNQSKWISACVVRRHLNLHPGQLAHEALRAALEAVLAKLETESPLHADVLRGRFWEGLGITMMRAEERPAAVSEGQFHVYQREAVRRFTRILLEQEALCCESGALKPAATPMPPPTRPTVRSRHLLVGLVVILLGIGAAAWLLRAAAPPSSPVDSKGLAPVTTGMTGTVTANSFVCGESKRGAADSVPRFVRHQGVSAFTVENTGGLVLSNWVRSLAIDPRGLWIGYFSSEGDRKNGLGQYNKKDWADCNSPSGTAGMNVNDIAIDHQGRVWVAAERVGVAMFDGTGWRRFTTADGLPSADTFSLTVDPRGHIWVGTWSGVAEYDGTEWSTPYAVQNKTIFNDHVHAIAFDSAGNFWVGHIKDGVSLHRDADGKWVHLTKGDGGLGGDQVRSIIVRPEFSVHPESVWIATSDGGVSKYEQGRWTVYSDVNGLPSNDVRDLAIDRYHRIWAATVGGVAYFDDHTWVVYHTLEAYTVAVGPDCQGCPFDTDHVWTGTAQNGLTHSRIPLDTDAIDVIKVTYPHVVKPGERFAPEIVVAPRAPFQLKEDRGDFLSNTDEDDEHLFGAFEHIAVKGVVDAGKAFIFTAPDTPFVAPQLPAGVSEQEFTSTWRVWMYTRYVGPPIHITFTVRR
jgi:hypothetical protein